MATKKSKNVVIWTKSRPWTVVHGELVSREGDTAILRNARMAVYWAMEVRGVLVDVKRLSTRNPEHTPFTVAEDAKRLAGWARRRAVELEEGRFLEDAEAIQMERARSAALPWWEHEAEILALHLERIKETLRQMQSPRRPAADERRFAAPFLPFDPQTVALASAFAFYLENDLLLADVHGGNIGLVEGRVGKSPVITDPGHAVPLSSRWQTVQVPVLP